MASSTYELHLVLTDVYAQEKTNSFNIVEHKVIYSY